MTISHTPTKTALGWVKDSLQLLKRSPRKWMLLALAYVGIFMMLPSLPGFQLFAYVTILIWPIFIAVAMRLFQSAEQARTENLAQILTLIQPKMMNLVLLGFICLAYGVLVSYVLSADMQSFSAVTAKQQAGMTEQQVADLLNQMLPFLSKAILFLIPLLMATWFAPMLMAFNQYSLLKSIKSSIAGSLQYLWPIAIAWLLITAGIMAVLLVFGMVMGIIGALLPAVSQLLMVLMVFAILLFATALMLGFQYVTYRDIFKAAPTL